MVVELVGVIVLIVLLSIALSMVMMPPSVIVKVVLPTRTAVAPTAALARFRPPMSLTFSTWMTTAHPQGAIVKRACS